MKAMMERLDGTAQKKALLTFGQPVQKAIDVVKSSHLGEKISDPDKIPPELRPVVTYQAGNLDAIEDDAAYAAYEEEKRKAELRESTWIDLLIDFGVWFWGPV